MNIPSEHRATREPALAPPHYLCERLHRVYHQLALLPSLNPCENVNALFQELVELVRTGSPAACSSLLQDPVLAAVQERMQGLCSEGESRLEAHWARRIVDAPADEAWRVLESFPYFENYERLARLELSALTVAADNSPLRRALFVGSGPLPLTSLLLAARRGLSVVNLDIDPEAVALGQQLAHKLGVSSMTFIASNVLEHHDLEGVDAVFLAALVGRHRVEKRLILQHLEAHLSPGASVVVRSAHRLRTLLYPDVSVDELGGLVPLLEVHPHDDVINSVIIARPSSAPID